MDEKARDDVLAAGCETLTQVLRFRAEGLGERVVYRFVPSDGEAALSITFGELEHRACSIAARLQEISRPGDRAILLYQPGLEYIAAFFGCLFAGVIAVPAYPPHPRRPDPRVRSIIADAGATIGLSTAALFARLEQWRASDRSIGDLSWLATDDVGGDAGAWRPPATDGRGSAVAMLQYTSGSTSEPRGVMLTHGNLLHNLALVHQTFEHAPQDLGVFWLPPFHDMGLIGGILEAAYAGLPSVLMPPATFLQRPASWLEAITKYRATTSGAPNFAYDLCVDRVSDAERATLDLSGWRTAFNGAEPVRAETMERFARAFAGVGFRREAFYPCYGLAEGTLMVAGGPRSLPSLEKTASRAGLEHNRVLPPAGARDAVRLVASGCPAGDLCVRVVDPMLREPCADGHVGEIWVSGRSVAQGYWARPAESEDTFGARLPNDNGGHSYLRTGDLGFLLDGRLFVTGRLKDLIVLDGRNHYPNDLELAAERSHPSLRAGYAAAFAVERDDREELAIAIEVSRHQDPSEMPAIVTAVRAATASRCGVLPDTVLLVRQNGIPRTSSGKVMRRATRAMFLGGKLDVAFRDDTSAGLDGRTDLRANGGAPADRRTGDGAILERWIANWVATELEVAPESLDPHGSLRDHGLDSLTVVRFVVALESDLGIRVEASTVWSAQSIASLAQELTSGAASGRLTPDRRAGWSDDSPVDDFPEFYELAARFETLKHLGLRNPYFVVHEGVGRTGSSTRIAGRELLNFSNYNYLGLAGHPAVNAAARDAIDRYGTSASASRLVSGERPLHGELEREIAGFLGVDAALAFVGGHATNVTTIAHLFGKDDVICCDELVHNSAAQGAQFSGARVLQFPHNDWRALDRLLGAVRGSYRRALIVIEGVYSADGDIPDLAAFVGVKQGHRALLMVDEAHSLGVLGATGRGIAEHAAVEPRAVDIWMGTLSKSLASCGGYIAGRQALVEYLRYSAPGFVFSVGMTPPNAAAALAALQVLRAEPDRVRQVQANGRCFLELARSRGVDTGSSAGTPVVPAIVGDSMRAVRLSQMLFERGVNVQPMVAPAVENDRARLRFFVSALHTGPEVHFAVDKLAESLAELR